VRPGRVPANDVTQPQRTRGLTPSTISPVRSRGHQGFHGIGRASNRNHTRLAHGATPRGFRCRARSDGCGLSPKGKITPSRSLADALAERRTASAEAPPSPKLTALCSICKDVGFMVADVPYGDPHFGTLVPCVCKEKERHESRIRESLRIGSLRRHQQMSFANFDPAVNASIYQAYNAARRFAAQPLDFFVLIGAKGTGKTHLAAAIANQRLRAGDEVVFVVVPDMLDRFRSSFHPDSEDRYDQLFDRVQACALLVLDDIGTQNPTPGRMRSCSRSSITATRCGCQPYLHRIRIPGRLTAVSSRVLTGACSIGVRGS
jgi:hypothetical protein